MRMIHWCLLSTFLPGALLVGAGMWIRYVNWGETDWVVLLLTDLHVTWQEIMGVIIIMGMSFTLLKAYPILIAHTPNQSWFGLTLSANFIGIVLILANFGLSGISLEAAQFSISAGLTLFIAAALAFMSSVIGEIAFRLRLYGPLQ